MEPFIAVLDNLLSYRSLNLVLCQTIQKAFEIKLFEAMTMLINYVHLFYLLQLSS